MISIVNQAKRWGALQNRHAVLSAMLFLMLAFVIGSAMVGSVLSILKLTGLMPQFKTYTLQALAGATIVFSTIIAASIISAHIWARWLGYEGVEFIGLNRDYGKFYTGTLWGIGLMALIFLMLVSLKWLHIDSVSFDQQAIINVLIITISSVNAGVMEEVVFRGVLYSALRFRWSRWVAAIIISACFSLFHFINNSYEYPVSAALGLFVVGLLFTWVKETAAGLWLPIGIHFAWDAASGWFNLLARQSPHLIMISYTVPTWLVGEFGLSDWVMLLIFAISVWIYKY